MDFDYITGSWMNTASEDELRSAESELRGYLDQLDYDSDEHTRLFFIHGDLVEVIASRFPLHLPHREHGWYLPNDD